MTEDVFRMFQAILEDRPTNFLEIMVDGYVGFLLVYKGYSFPEPDLIGTNPQSTWNLSYHPYCL